VPIAQRHIRDDGRFSFRWIPKNKNVGSGDWRLVAACAARAARTARRSSSGPSTRITIN
jgi:hypothetical protein